MNRKRWLEREREREREIETETTGRRKGTQKGQA